MQRWKFNHANKRGHSWNYMIWPMRNLKSRAYSSVNKYAYYTLSAKTLTSPCYEVLSMFDHFHPLQPWMVYFCPLARPLWNQIYGFGLLTTLILSHQAMFVKDCDQWGKSMLTHSGRDKMAAVLQTTLSNAFSWIKMLEFHWSLFLRFQLTISQHCFR